MESILGYVDEDATVHAIRPKIQREVAEIETAQINWLKRSLAVALQPLGPPFLGQHDVESIRAPVIIPGLESKLEQLYGAGSRIEQKSLELYQDQVAKARLDCLALEIVERKKEVAARQLQSEKNLAKDKEVVDALATII